MPDQTPSMPPLPEPDATTVGQGQVWNRHSVLAYAQAVADERVRAALELAYDAMFGIAGCKATRFNAQTAIRELAARQVPGAAFSTLSLG